MKLKRILLSVFIIVLIIQVGCTKNVKSENEEITNTKKDGATVEVNEEKYTQQEPNHIIDIREFEETIDILAVEVIEGKSKAAIKEEYQENYSYILSFEEDGYLLLKEYFDELTSEHWESDNLTLVRKKLALEWLMSENVRNQNKVNAEITESYGYTVVEGNNIMGKLQPDLESLNIRELENKMVIRITGNIDEEWYLATVLAEDTHMETENIVNYTIDGSEFWIYKNDIINSIIYEKDAQSDVDMATQYKYLVNEEYKESYTNPFTGLTEEYITLRERPDTDSKACGYLNEGDLVWVKKDESGRRIKDGDWWLIGQFITDWDVSSIGWVDVKNLELLTKKSIANQGFLRGGTPIYENSDGTSSKEFNEFFDGGLDYTQIMPINITQRNNGKALINAGLNTFSGWVDERLINYSLPEVQVVKYKEFPEVKVEDGFMDISKYERLDQFIISNQLSLNKKTKLVQMLESYQEEYRPFSGWKVVYYDEDRLVIDQGELVSIDLTSENYGILGTIDVRSMDVGDIQGSQISYVFVGPTGEQVVIGSAGIDGEPDLYFADFLTGEISTIAKKVFLADVKWYQDVGMSDSYILGIEVENVSDRGKNYFYWNTEKEEKYLEEQESEFGDLNRIYSNNSHENYEKFKSKIEDGEIDISVYDLGLLFEDGSKLIYSSYDFGNDPKSSLRYLDFDLYELDFQSGEEKMLEPLIDSKFYINDFIVDIMMYRSGWLTEFPAVSDKTNTVILKTGALQLDTLINYNVVSRDESEIQVDVVYSINVSHMNNPLIVVERWKIIKVKDKYIIDEII